MPTDRLPAVLTHNYHPARGKFRNLCTLPPAEAEAILDRIRSAGLARLKPDYLARRLATEAWLLAERTRKLGPPRLAHPIYFFLGDRADGLDPARPHSCLVPLAAFDPAMLTFTNGDSMASRELARQGLPHHGQVYTLAEIARLMGRAGLPHATDGVGARGFRPFIEVQVWDDRPLAGL